MNQMATYKELQDQIESLQKEAEEARLEEIKSAVGQIRNLMAEHDLSLEDIQASSSKKKSAPGFSNVKFRDESGNTWSGRGRMPAWLKGKDREQFRVG
jgi:DNA-binding protein H-NS